MSKETYDSMSPMPNKFLNPDGTTSTLFEALNGNSGSAGSESGGGIGKGSGVLKYQNGTPASGYASSYSPMNMNLSFEIQYYGTSGYGVSLRQNSSGYYNVAIGGSSGYLSLSEGSPVTIASAGYYDPSAKIVPVAIYTSTNDVIGMFRATIASTSGSTSYAPSMTALIEHLD